MVSWHMCHPHEVSSIYAVWGDEKLIETAEQPLSHELMKSLQLNT